MISIHSKYETNPGSLVSYQASTDGKTGWFLLTWHPEKDFVLEELNAEIKLEIIKADPLSLSKVEAERWLKDFFAEYHWKLHARLRKTNLQERGLSVFFGLLYENEIIFVQFGRMLCGLIDQKGLHEQGRSWKHYHVKAAAELELLGYAESDIRVRSQRSYIAEKTHFVVLPSGMAVKLMDQLQEPGTIQALLESYKAENNAVWLQLAGLSNLHAKRKRKLSRLQISTIVLICIALVAAAYMAFGNRFIDQGLHKLKLFYRSKSVSTLEELPNTLRLRNADILKIMDRVVNASARNVEFRVAWTKELPYEVTAIPSFDLERIYIASGKNLLAFHKKNQESAWNLALDENITSILVAQGNLVLSLENRQVIGIKSEGSIIWALPLDNGSVEDEGFEARQISTTEDPRIEGSIIVIPQRDKISVIDSNKGDLFSSIELKQELRYLSAYDSFDSCFYAVVGSSLMKIDLVVLN